MGKVDGVARSSYMAVNAQVSKAWLSLDARLLRSLVNNLRQGLCLELVNFEERAMRKFSQ